MASELRGGVLVVDKPAGPTSHDVVAVARRARRGLKVGHIGTLDPFATGVLPLVIGKATRLARFLSDGDKVYEAAIRLGLETDTYDVTGAAVFDRREQAAALPPGLVGDALARFVGAHLQVPPPFSAKKLGGVPAYDRARRGEPVRLEPAPVVLEEARILEHAGSLLRVRLRCSPGYYVRALAHDLGAALGAGGALEALRRLQSGPFDGSGAVTLDVLAADPAAALGRVIPLEALLPELPALRLTAEGVRRVADGVAVGPAQLAGGPAGPPAGNVRLLTPEGLLLGLGRAQADGTIRPALFLGWR